jgi:hypothetical protein
MALIATATGHIQAPVQISDDETSALFLLRDGDGNTYQVQAFGDEIITAAQNYSHTGEAVMIAGHGYTYMWRHCKKHHFGIKASFIVPMYDLDRAELSGLIRQLSISNVLSLVTIRKGI